jgi:Protein of unknown function (DUF3631)
LIAIADLAGDDWPDRARSAAVERSGHSVVVDDGAVSVQLLACCRQAFGERDRLSTKELITGLCDDEEAPWGSWHKGAPISPRGLARLLVPFGIRSRSIRMDDETPKGYLRVEWKLTSRGVQVCSLLEAVEVFAAGHRLPAQVLHELTLASSEAVELFFLAVATEESGADLLEDLTHYARVRGAIATARARLEGVSG